MKPGDVEDSSLFFNSPISEVFNNNLITGFLIRPHMWPDSKPCLSVHENYILSKFMESRVHRPSQISENYMHVPNPVHILVPIDLDSILSIHS